MLLAGKNGVNTGVPVLPAESSPRQKEGLTKDSTVPEDKFDWPSGASGGKVNIDFPDKTVKPEVLDWYIYPSNKSFDSQQRAHWRRGLFWISLVLFVLAFTGGIFEGVEKYREKREPFSPQLCLQTLIGSIEGDDDKESQRMRTTLEKVLLEGSTVQDAIAPLKLGPIQQKIFWLKPLPL